MAVDIKNIIETINKLSKDYSRYNFCIPNSCDLDRSLIIYAINNIKRADYIIELSDILNDFKKAVEIEEGIFEFSLLHTFMNNSSDHFVVRNYIDKFIDIKTNINGDPKINNNTLKQNILNNEKGNNYVAFMSPEQLHPEKWKACLDHMKTKEEQENVIATTSLYKCKKCGERKATLRQMQIRCSDEPVSTFITCQVCYNTFVI